jgi:hypothetical protein
MGLNIPCPVTNSMILYRYIGETQKVNFLEITGIAPDFKKIICTVFDQNQSKTVQMPF